jgi:hypothetical protein
MIALFFMVEWDRYRFNKKRVGTRYAELVFLHPVGSVGHVVHTGASGHKISTQYFSCSGAPDAVMSYPIPRKRERSLHTYARDVQITRIVTT